MNFWSRRLAKVAAEEQHVQSPATDPAPEEERSDEEILRDLELPEPETLKAGDDFSVFMAQAVPGRIRRRALRVLWRSNPVLANLDGLVDYDDDFTDAATVVPGMKTAYQVGRGMLAHVERMQAVLSEEESGSGTALVADVAETEDKVSGAPLPESLAMQPGHLAAAEPEEAPQQPCRPRRMQFRFEAESA